MPRPQPIHRSLRALAVTLFLLPTGCKKNDGKDEVHLTVEKKRDLKGNWIDAIREKDTLRCNVELGTATMVAIKMAVESYRQRKTLAWDSKSEKVVPA